jgi:hypothetical protein
MASGLVHDNCLPGASFSLDSNRLFESSTLLLGARRSLLSANHSHSTKPTRQRPPTTKHAMTLASFHDTLEPQFRASKMRMPPPMKSTAPKVSMRRIFSSVVSRYGGEDVFVPGMVRRGCGGLVMPLSRRKHRIMDRTQHGRLGMQRNVRNNSRGIVMGNHALDREYPTEVDTRQCTSDGRSDTKTNGVEKDKYRCLEVVVVQGRRVSKNNTDHLRKAGNHN